MHRNSTLGLLIALMLAVGVVSQAAAHNNIRRGFVCIVDLPPFDPSGQDATSKTTTESQLTCAGGGSPRHKQQPAANIHLKCRAALSPEDFAALGGKTKTYKDTPCQIDLRMCGDLPPDAQRFVLARKSELRINKKEAKIECQL